jgi:hypothetical protein
MTHYQAALEILLKSLPPRHSHCIDARLGIGRALVELGRPREALESLEMALKGRSDGTATPFYRGEARFALARALGESGADRKRARELAEAARSDFATLENTQGAVQVAAVDKWLASGAGRSPAHKR